ncbi:unnamed protein product [Auanema sp. JU1783]|nr:unnamed protein product [Auanema sp. JU1783]
MTYRIVGSAALATSLLLYYNRNLRYLLQRKETCLFALLLIWVYYYVKEITQYFIPRIRGFNLRQLDLVHRHRYDLPEFIDKGFSDLSRDENLWRIMHERFTYAAAQGFRPYMEDRMHYMYDPNLNLAIFGIFDGHGGMYISDYLECHFAVSLRHRLMRLKQKLKMHNKSSSLADDPISEAVITQVFELDDAISRLDKKYTSLTGSTLICAILEKNRFLTIINVGDSRAVACDMFNRAVALSRDHKPDDREERRRVEVAGGFVNCDDDGSPRIQGILSVSRAFGDTLLKRLGVLTARPDVQRIDLHKKPLKFLIVGTDGFWDVVTNSEAIKLANEFLKSREGKRDWHRISTYLVQLALERQSKDNVSVLFLKLY